MCLGCHATGAEAEEWEKDETFHVEDGVQCEKCHGRGQRVHGREEVMTDPKAARGCRLDDAAEERLHELPQGQGLARGRAQGQDLTMWMRRGNSCSIPTPEKWEYPDEPTFPEPIDAQAHQHVGSIKCAECHKSPEMGYQYSKWRMSGHASGLRAVGYGTRRARSRRRPACRAIR